jgi:hypothetical protein
MKTNKDAAMSSQTHLSEMIIIGNPISLECPSPQTSFAVIFEDEGETGYFYGLNLENKKQPVMDSLHIYDVRDLLDPNVSVQVDIFWSEDGLKSRLEINGFPHAVFDFESRKAYCRTNYPRPDRRFTNSHQWSDEALDLFKE